MKIVSFIPIKFNNQSLLGKNTMILNENQLVITYLMMWVSKVH